MYGVYGYIVAVQSFSPVRFFLALGPAACQASLSFTISQSLLNLMCIESVDAIQPSCLSAVVPFSSCLQSLPASGSFLMSLLFASGSQRTWASASASVLSVNIQDLFPLWLTGLISLQSKGLSRVFNTTAQKHQFFGVQPSLWSNSHIPLMTTGKTTASTIWTFVSKVTSLLLIQS